MKRGFRWSRVPFQSCTFSGTFTPKTIKPTRLRVFPPPSPYSIVSRLKADFFIKVMQFTGSTVVVLVYELSLKDVQLGQKKEVVE